MSEHFEFYELDPPKEGDQPQLPPMFSSQEVLSGQSVFNKAVTAEIQVMLVLFSIPVMRECLMLQ